MIGTSKLTKTLVATASAVSVVAGVWVTGNLTPNVFAHGATLAVWIVITISLQWTVTRKQPAFRKFAIGGTLVTLVLVIAAGAWLSRPTSVDEKIVTAATTSTTSTPDSHSDMMTESAMPDPTPRGNTLVASGAFESLAHTTRGAAQVIELEDGSAKLTLQDFKTDPGPDLYVYVVAGNPSGDGDVDEYINLGKLKGTEGNQQYDLPDKFDAVKYAHVYVWCKAFTVGFGRAKLKA